jgi:hypothetical protein
MTAEERQRRIDAIAGRLHGRRLTAPLRLILDALAPIDVISSQLVLLFRPLVPLGQWRADLAALEETEAWSELRQRLDHPPRG